MLHCAMLHWSSLCKEKGIKQLVVFLLILATSTDSCQLGRTLQFLQDQAPILIPVWCLLVDWAAGMLTTKEWNCPKRTTSKQSPFPIKLLPYSAWWARRDVETF